MLLKVKENEKILIKKIEISFSGPTEQTLDDFIRMIIEQQITVIVMLSFPYDPITCTYAVS
jgi:protein tyrosine phosphatase